jgi:hypothetical protein
MDPQSDTAVRQFHPGTVLSYGANIYNAKVDPAGQINLTTQAKLFNEKTVIFEGKPTPVSAAGGSAETFARGSLLLGADLPAGNYPLQVILTDNNAKEGRRVAFQFVPFEIVQ